MEPGDDNHRTFTVRAHLIRQILVGTFSIGTFTPGVRGFGKRAERIVQVRQSSGRIGIEEADAFRTPRKHPNELFVHSWVFGELQAVQLFKPPSTTRSYVDPDFPFGVRVHFGGWRMPLLLFADHQESLVDALRIRGVSV